MKHTRNVSRTIAICAMLFLSIAVVVACDGDADGPATTPTSTASPAIDTPTPAVESAFPVVLEHETLIVARADGSEITETPLEPPTGAISGEYVREYVSPDGLRTATYRDGAVFIQEGGSDPAAIAEVPFSPGYLRLLWSPDSSRLLFDASFSEESSSIYVINADGSGLTDVGAGLDGDAFPVAWSPAGQRLAFGVYPSPRDPALMDALMYVAQADGTERTLMGDYSNYHGWEGADLAKWSPDGSRIAAFSPHPDGAIRLMDASGGPAVDIAGSRLPRFSWSPDGRSLAFHSSAPDGNAVMVVDIAAPSEPRVLTEGFHPRWSPAGDRIAFKRGGQPERVFTIRPDGSGLIALGDADPPTYFGDLTWSLDGQELEFVRTASDIHYLYELDLRSGEVTRSARSLGEEPSFTHGFYLSPYGERIAFPRYEGKEGGGETGWFTMNIATGELTQLTDDSRGDDVYWSPETLRVVFSAGPGGVYVAEGDRSPPRRISELEAYPLAWSPDGKYVAFGAGEDIHVLDVDGTDDRVVAGRTPAFERVQRIEWSPDGNQLLYEAETRLQMGTDTTETFVASLDGTPPVPLTSSQGSITGARWSPDGGTIAFSHREDLSREVWLMDADGTNERRLASLEEVAFGGGQPRWSPDGAMIGLVAGQNDLWIIDVEAGLSMLVATNVGNCIMTFVGWSPDSQVIYAIPRCGLGGL